MSLTQAQRVIVEKARALGGGRQGVALDDSVCTYLVGTIATDLGLLVYFPEFREGLAPFSAQSLWIVFDCPTRTF